MWRQLCLSATMLRMTAQHWINLYPLSLLLLIPMYIALVVWVISRASGWALLARRFHCG